MAMEVYRVSDGDETTFTFGELLGGSVGGNNKVNPGVFFMGLIYDSVLIGMPGEVIDVVNGGIAEFEPHRSVENVPPAEIAVRDGVIR